MRRTILHPITLLILTQMMDPKSMSKALETAGYKAAGYKAGA